MQTKLSALAARVIEGGWLAALIIVPLLFNIYTERVFEEDKIPLMRSIALLISVGLLIWGIERGREALEVDGKPWWKLPLVLPALLLTGAYLLSTIFSIVPHISFWGAYIRRQGTYTWLSYIAIFFGILFLARDRRQVTRIITVILLASVPATLYAFLQNRGLDPLPWGGDVTRRVSSTAGNAIFISAYLIMVMPLTFMRVIEHFKQLLRSEDEEDGDGEQPNYLASAILAGAYLFLLIIQGLTIVFSQSRGPTVGLLAGMAFFLILASLPINRWVTTFWVVLAVGGIAFLALFNAPNSPLEPLKSVPYLGRLGRVFELDQGNGRVRVLIWEGAVDLLAANPVRDVVGYGPEAMYVAYNPHYPPELSQVEQRNASPDRSHNETFDSLVMTGMLGFVAQLALYISLFYYALKWIGLIHSTTLRNAFLALIGIGGLAGGVLPYFMEGSFRLSGVGLPAGISAGLIVYVLGYAVTHLSEVGKRQHPQSLLLIALLSALFAHFIEVHFGIAIGVTRLYFWVYAALVVVVGMPLVHADALEIAASEAPADASSAAKRKRRPVRRATRGGTVLTGTLLSLSLLMGLILMVMTFDFYTPTIDLSAKGFSIIWLFLGTWLFGALLVVAETAIEQEDRSAWLPRLATYAAISLGAWAIFALIYVPWIQQRPPTSTITEQDLAALGGQLANAITVIYLFTFGTIGLTALVLQREEHSTRFTMRAPNWMGAVYGGLLVGILPMIVLTNLNVSRADVFNKQGTGYERQNQWDVAIFFYKTALAMQSEEDRYFLNMGRAYMEKARTITDNPSQREYFLEEARAVLERAQRTNPLNTDHTRNLASLHRVWASLSTDPTTRESHLAKADEYYAQAVKLSPNNAAIWNDWASLAAERGRMDEAEARLNQSLEIDAQWVNTYLLRANIVLQDEDYETALATYNEALERFPGSVPALSGRAFALARLGRTEEAIAANQEVLALDPDDYNTLKNLALLYQELGQFEQALDHARRARAVASPQDQAAMDSFIQQLTAQQSSATPGGGE